MPQNNFSYYRARSLTKFKVQGKYNLLNFATFTITSKCNDFDFKDFARTTYEEGEANCTSTNLVHNVPCVDYGKQYLGISTRKLKIRVKVHIHNIHELKENKIFYRLLQLLFLKFSNNDKIKVKNDNQKYNYGMF